MAGRCDQETCHDVPPVDNCAARVDVVALRSFFSAHPVDGVAAGRAAATESSFGIVPRCVPSRHTGRAACLHKLSTDLCTERLDEVRGSQKTVTTVL